METFLTQVQFLSNMSKRKFGKRKRKTITMGVSFTTKVHANADRHKQKENIAIEKRRKEKISRITSARSWLAGSFISSFSLVPNRKEQRRKNLWLAGYWKCSRKKRKKRKEKGKRKGNINR